MSQITDRTETKVQTNHTWRNCEKYSEISQSVWKKYVIPWYLTTYIGLKIESR